MLETPCPLPDPQDSCVQIMRAVRSSGLTWGTQETPYSIFLTICKRFLKNAKNISNTARPPTHTLTHFLLIAIFTVFNSVKYIKLLLN